MRLWPFSLMGKGRRAGKRKGFTVVSGSTSASDDARTVGTGTDSSLVMAPLIWLARNVSTIPIHVRNAEGEEVVNDALLGLLTQRIMYSASVDYQLHGNVFLEIVRGDIQQPIQLRYLAPHWVVPRTRIGSDEIAYYQVTQPTRTTYELNPEDVLHIAQGIDPDRPQLGFSPLRAVLKDVAIDVEAGNALSSFLKNGALMGVVVTPVPGDVGEGQMDEAQAKLLQSKLDKAYSSNGRGKTLVTAMPVEVKQTVAELGKMAMKEIRGLSETRVSAALGIPGAVVGFASGLEQTKVGATMRELRGLAWENAVIPTVDAILDGLNNVVVPEVADRLMFGYTLPAGHVSATNDSILAERARDLYTSGIITRNEARALVGEEPVDGAEGGFAEAGAPAMEGEDDGE